MSRGVGAIEPIQTALPDWAAVLLALLTQLGDVWFVGLLLVVLYWRRAERRTDIAFVGGLWLAGIGLYKGLKATFAVPRPDRPLLEPDALPALVQPVYEATALASGYGFPSGHAVGTTVVYFGLAWVLGVSTRRRRVAGAAAIVATVCFTRVALGVHYAVDVVAGVAVGLLLLGGAWVLVERRPTDRTSIAFGLAVVFGAFFLVASDVDPDAVLVLAASVGFFAVRRFVDSIGRAPS